MRAGGAAISSSDASSTEGCVSARSDAIGGYKVSGLSSTGSGKFITARAATLWRPLPATQAWMIPSPPWRKAAPRPLTTSTWNRRQRYGQRDRPCLDDRGCHRAALQHLQCRCRARAICRRTPPRRAPSGGGMRRTGRRPVRSRLLRRHFEIVGQRDETSSGVCAAPPTQRQCPRSRRLDSALGHAEPACGASRSPYCRRSAWRGPAHCASGVLRLVIVPVAAYSCREGERRNAASAMALTVAIQSETRLGATPVGNAGPTCHHPP